MSRRKPTTRIALLTLTLLILSTTIASATAGKITATDVKFRREANTSAEIIDLLNKGAALDIVKTQGDWYKVRIGNVNGYVHSDYVKLVKEAPAAVASPVASTAAKPAATPVPAAAAVTRPAGTPVETPVAETAPVAAPVAPEGTVATGPAAVVATPAKPTENILHVSANTLNIRETASAESKKLGELARGDAVALLETTGIWAKIKAGGGTVGYVLNEYLSTNASISRGAAGDDRIDELVRVAMSFKGVRYVYGAASRKGTDCSGFTMQVYKAIGISVPRSSNEYGSVGTKISRDKLQVGDVVLFDTDGGKRTNISHVGIYLGNDKFIHASSTNHKVMVASFSGYQAKYLGARRFMK